MDTSASNNWHLVEKTQPWYGIYDHSMTFYLSELHCMRSLDHAMIDKIVNIRRQWGQRLHQPQPGRWSWQALDINDQHVTDLHRLCQAMLDETSPIKLVINSNTGYLYSQAPDVLQRILALEILDRTKIRLSKLRLVGDPNTVRLKNPRHGYRSYLRGWRKIDSDKKNTLARLIQQDPDLRPSGALGRWLDSPRTAVSDYFFLDHNDTGILLIMNLVQPGMIRKTLRIEAAK